MIKAVFNDIVVAETERAVVIEGNVYFPPESLRRRYFSPSPTRSLCIWKGVAHYLTVSADGVTSRDVAWTYPRPWPLARRIRGHVAFWNGIRVEVNR